MEYQKKLSGMKQGKINDWKIEKKKGGEEERERWRKEERKEGSKSWGKQQITFKGSTIKLGADFSPTKTKKEVRRQCNDVFRVLKENNYNLEVCIKWKYSENESIKICTVKQKQNSTSAFLY